jgi:nickel superoxide dismutase
MSTMSADRHPAAAPKSLSVSIVALLLLAAWSPRVAAHCQVPCGIYDDEGRIAQLLEDTRTIEKATASIQELAGKSDAQSANQLTRWINTKEQHASHIITTVSEYFLTQKVKPVSEGSEGYDEYMSHLAQHHAVMVAAMKTKQKVDPAVVTALRQAIEAMAKHYTQH